MCENAKTHTQSLKPYHCYQTVIYEHSRHRSAHRDRDQQSCHRSEPREWSETSSSHLLPHTDAGVVYHHESLPLSPPPRNSEAAIARPGDRPPGQRYLWASVTAQTPLAQSCIRTQRAQAAGVLSPRTFSWSHKVWVSKCRSFPSPDRVDMPMAALESVHAVTGRSSPMSFISDW